MDNTNDEYNKILSKMVGDNQNNTKTYLNSIANGRVNIMGTPLSKNAFPLFQQSKNSNILYSEEAVRSIQTETDLGKLFFSKGNIMNLQNIIRYRVWLESNKKHVVGLQSESQLKIIMRSIYFQYGKFRNKKLINQVKELNEVVCKYCVPNILSNVEQYLGYKKTVSYLPTPIPLPEYLSVAGTKSYSN